MGSVEFGVLTCIIIFLSQNLKVNFGVDKKHIPILNVLIGMVLSATFVSFMPNFGLADRILHGLVSGMSASGMYDVGASFYKDKQKIDYPK